MQHSTLTVKNYSGLHARPASQLIELANTFASSVIIKHAEVVADAKSIISLLSAGIKQGTVIELEVEGADEKEAIAAITELINGLEG
jgi:Phosphotransferase System HPr (HPr) Family